VIRFGERFDGPVHARGEIVLERFAPAPDRRLIRSMALAVGPD
jgi:hypothetical protein